MQRTLPVVLAISIVFTLALALRAQLPANLDCKCAATGDGEYLCKCVAAKGSAETPAKPTTAAASKQETPASTANTTDTPSKPATPTAKAGAGETPNGTTTASGQPNYTGPRGGEYHYSTSGKKVYTRKK
jgi:hypothetical protein